MSSSNSLRALTTSPSPRRDSKRSRTETSSCRSPACHFQRYLSVGAAAERVEVHASDVPLINSTDATLGNNFDNKQVLLLPSEGRNPVELLSLQPGVTYTGNQVDHPPTLVVDP